MGNTIRYFQWKEQQWLTRATDSQGPGHVAYSYQQAEMWKALARKAEDKFGSNAK